MSARSIPTGCGPSPGPMGSRRRPTVWTHGSCRCSATRFPWRTRNGASRTRSGPNCATCCGAGVSWSTSECRNSTLDKGITEGSRASTKRHIAWLDDEIARLEEEYRPCKPVRSCPDGLPFTSGRGHTHCGYPGGGFALGEGDGKQLTSLVGLAPWSRDSGRHRGYRASRGAVRRALYLAALSLIRCKNSTLASFYQQLRQRGKPGKLALVAVMRKLLLQLHAIARRGTPWVQNYASAT